MMTKYYEAGNNCQIQSSCIVGLRYREDCLPVKMGNAIVIRAGTIIYGDVQIGDDFQTGHNVMIREKTIIGNHVVIGTNTVIDGNVTIDDFVKIESNCYIPTHTQIGSRVFFGPNVTLTNDRYPLKMRESYSPEGPIIGDGVTLSAGVVVCPGLHIGEDSFVAAGAVVTKNVPPGSMVIGIPGRFTPLPEKLRHRNMAISWMKYLKE